MLLDFRATFRSTIALLALVILFGTSTLYLYVQNISLQTQTPKPAQAPALEKFKAGGYYEANDADFLLRDAAKDTGIWAKYGLDPEFVTIPGRPVVAADLKEWVASGIKIGVGASGEVLLTRGNGIPIKILGGYTGLSQVKIFVKSDVPIKSARDLDGKKIGLISVGANPTYRHFIYFSNKFAIKPEPVPLGNLTNMVVALKLGRIDAFMTVEAAPLRLVNSGELRIVVNFPDEVYPKLLISFVIWATDDLIEQKPDLVRRFVKSVLETVKYLEENPSYAANLYVRRSNAPKDLADKAVSQIAWVPSGRGSGNDLVAAVATTWQFNKDTNLIPGGINIKIEDVVDVRFLP